jgi:DNA-binding MarR family transcriptional regulator
MLEKRPRRKTREIRGIRLDQEQWVAYRLSMLSGHNARGLAAMYTKRFRITVAQWRVLTVIGRHSPASATTVANHTSLEPDKVTRAVDSLVRLGMVNRRSDRRDRRFVVLTLSANGKRVNHEIQMVRNAMELELVGALTLGETRTLYRLLDKLQARAARMFKNPDAWREILAKHRHEMSLAPR